MLKKILLLTLVSLITTSYTSDPRMSSKQSALRGDAWHCYGRELDKYRRPSTPMPVRNIQTQTDLAQDTQTPSASAAPTTSPSASVAASNPASTSIFSRMLSLVRLR